MDRVKAILAIGLMAFLALLPLSWSRKLGRSIGLYQWRQGRKSKATRNTIRNIEACFPQLDKQTQEDLSRESLIHTGYALAEMGMSWLWKPARTLKLVKSVKGEELLTEQFATGKGVLLIAPHLGNWEIMNLYLSQRYPVTAMYKPPRLEMVDKLIKRMRARLGSHMAPANASGIRMVLKGLRRPEVVGILPDQEPEDNGGVFAPFFGVEAWTMKLLPQLAAQTKVRVLCGYAARLPDGGYELRFSDAGPDIYSKDVAVSAAAMNAAIERCVLEAPEQYQWEYRRFQTRPDGKKGFY